MLSASKNTRNEYLRFGVCTLSSGDLFFLTFCFTSENYLFQCDCEKCVEQTGHSDESDADDDEDGGWEDDE